MVPRPPDDLRQDAFDLFDVGKGGFPAEREAHQRMSQLFFQADGADDVGRFD